MGFDPFGALASLAGGVAGFYFGGPMGAAAGSGLGTALYTGDIGKGVQSGLLSYGLGSALSGLGSAGAGEVGTDAGTWGAEGAAGATSAAPGEAISGGASGLGDWMAQGGNAVMTPAAAPAASVAPTGVLNTAIAPGTTAASTGWGNITKPVSDFTDKLGQAAKNLSGPGSGDLLKKTFITNAGSTTLPIAMGLYSYMTDPGTGQTVAVPNNKQGYQWPTPDLNRTSGRTYTPRAANSRGYEQSYFSGPGYAAGGWIKGAIKHPGALHRELGIPEGTKIPASRLSAAANSDNPTLARRAHLAQTMRGFDGGGPVSGPGGGLDDAIPAIIDGRAPAKLSSGEYVVPAHAVSALGNGSTEAGVNQLDGMVDNVMQAKYGTTNRKPRPINPKSFAPGFADGGMVDETMMWLGLKDRPQNPPQNPQRSWDMDPPAPESWPTTEDAQAARLYKLKYGNPNERDITNQTKMSYEPKNQVFDRFANRSVFTNPTKPTPIGWDQADEMYSGQMAANRSPMAALGYDPDKQSYSKGLGAVSLGGAYVPSADRMWTHEDDRTSKVHESIHRGHRMLESDPEASALLKDMRQHWQGGEESLTRAEMLRRYGPVEDTMLSDETNKVRAGLDVKDDPNAQQMQLAARQLNDEDFRKQMLKLDRIAHRKVAEKTIAKQGGAFSRGGRV